MPKPLRSPGVFLPRPLAGRCSAAAQLASTTTPVGHPARSSEATPASPVSQWLCREGGGHFLAFHQAHRALDIIGRSRMAEGLEHQVIVFIPLAGMDMQFGDPSRGETLPQPFAKQISKEVVIAVPASLVVLRDDEQVGALDIFQGCLPGNGWVEQNGIAKRPAQAIKDRCAQQESLDAFGLLVQDLFHQIVQHEMVAAGEGLDEAGDVLMSLHGKRGQL